MKGLGIVGEATHTLIQPAPAFRETIGALEARLLQEAQAECPVVHHFGPGVYIREVTLRAGAFAVGHRQKTEHMNVMLRGRVRMLCEDGSMKELRAPCTFVGQPGRKAGFILEETVWQNIYATTETDVRTLEDMFLEKSPAFVFHQAQRDALEALERQWDREDFLDVLAELGLDEGTVRAQAEQANDLVPFPFGAVRVMVAPSPIEGQGLFATAPIQQGEVIAPARLGGLRTPAVRFTNHSRTPNAAMVMLPGGDVDLVALAPITGCHGGQPGHEITIDYRGVLKCLV